jgi:hypothetical protein
MQLHQSHLLASLRQMHLHQSLLALILLPRKLLLSRKLLLALILLPQSDAAPILNQILFVAAAAVHLSSTHRGVKGVKDLHLRFSFCQNFCWDVVSVVGADSSARWNM